MREQKLNKWSTYTLSDICTQFPNKAQGKKIGKLKKSERSILSNSKVVINFTQIRKSVIILYSINAILLMLKCFLESSYKKTEHSEFQDLQL